ncbi:MAG TPA: galactosyldiacylglycerol synthase, partial [Anaerolineaceae bacterium]|nr:galactosyldiacylglycerol synthase [Anaerolineaceae bacterium]
MSPHRPKPAHVLILFSDTGGGHRSAAEAIIEAIKTDFPGQITTEMVDIFKDYAPYPLDLAPSIYPPLSHLPDVWGLGYHLSDGQRRTRLVTNLMWPYVRRSLRQLIRERPCDLIVSVHPLANMPVLRALGVNRPP